jgi:hypothetical protein
MQTMRNQIVQRRVDLLWGRTLVALGTCKQARFDLGVTAADGSVNVAAGQQLSAPSGTVKWCVCCLLGI